jgi:hypothetical protein
VLLLDKERRDDGEVVRRYEYGIVRPEYFKFKGSGTALQALDECNGMGVLKVIYSLH